MCDKFTGAGDVCSVFQAAFAGAINAIPEAATDVTVAEGGVVEVGFRYADREDEVPWAYTPVQAFTAIPGPTAEIDGDMTDGSGHGVVTIDASGANAGASGNVSVYSADAELEISVSVE